MKKIEIKENLHFYTDYFNLIIFFNNRVKEYEEHNIATPDEIKELLLKMNVGANFLIIHTECIAISKCFNESKYFLYQIFFVKSIHRIIYEAFKIIDNYSSSLFKKNNIEKGDIEIMESIKNFRKKYDFKKIGIVRNNVASHYTNDFLKNISITNEIDVQQTLDMFYDFLELINAISNFIRKDIFSNDITTELEKYFKEVEKQLTDYYR